MPLSFLKINKINLNQQLGSGSSFKSWCYLSEPEFSVQSISALFSNGSSFKKRENLLCSKQMWQLRQLCVFKNNRYSYTALRLELSPSDAKVNLTTQKHNVKSVCNPKVANPVMSWNTGHCGHINCVFINVLNISWTVSTYFWTFFTRAVQLGI